PVQCLAGRAGRVGRRSRRGRRRAWCGESVPVGAIHGPPAGALLATDRRRVVAVEVADQAPPQMRPGGSGLAGQPVAERERLGGSGGAWRGRGRRGCLSGSAERRELGALGVEALLGRQEPCPFGLGAWRRRLAIGPRISVAGGRRQRDQQSEGDQRCPSHPSWPAETSETPETSETSDTSESTALVRGWLSRRCRRDGLTALPHTLLPAARCPSRGGRS